MSEFTYEEKAAEARREVKMRKSVYPRWVTYGVLSKDKAKLQIAMMEEIARDYEEMMYQEQAELDLEIGNRVEE